MDESLISFRISFAYFSLVMLARICENYNYFRTVTPVELRHSQFERDALTHVLFECIQFVYVVDNSIVAVTVQQSTLHLTGSGQYGLS